jgi:hypothetical protein
MITCKNQTNWQQKVIETNTINERETVRLSVRTYLYGEHSHHSPRHLLALHHNKFIPKAARVIILEMKREDVWGGRVWERERERRKDCVRDVRESRKECVWERGREGGGWRKVGGGRESGREEVGWRGEKWGRVK